jgi:hypothetical protein
MHYSGDGERMKPCRLIGIKAEISAIKRICASHAGAGYYAEAGALFLADLDPARFHRFLRSQQSKLAEAVQQIQPLGRKVILRIVIRDFGSNLNRQRGGIKLADAPERRPRPEQVLEEGFRIFPYRSKDSNAGNDNSSHVSPL